MRILGIETSCDETAAAVVENGIRVLSNMIATSKEAFQTMGGVIPEHAARRQIECMIPVVEQALKEAKTKPDAIDVIAVTKGPGLLGSLLVGTTTARTLASVWSKPLVEVNHTMGHLSSTWLEEKSQIPDPRSQTIPNHQLPNPTFPILALSVSGGHTELWYRESHTRGKLLGQTRDDAAGEAFDKGAKLLSLPYPGGPAIAKAAEGGDEQAVEFPLPFKGEKTLDFSCSGLKTALKYCIRRHQIPETRLQKGHRCQISDLEPGTWNLESSWNLEPGTWKLSLKDIAASYQHAICRHLVDRMQKALEKYPEVKEVHIVGGVSANMHLRRMLRETCKGNTLRFPVHISYCTDNAAMIAAAAYFILQEQCSPRSTIT